MHLVDLLAVAVGLGMDALAVAVASSVTLRRVSPRHLFRLSFHFGLFQAMMPVLGWLAGLTLADAIRSWDHWAAFGLLAFIGVRAIRASLAPPDPECGDEPAPQDPTRGLTLVTLSVATSVDALAVGLSFALVRVSIWYASAVIGLVAGGMTLAGMLLGCRMGNRFGRRMELVGGLVLIGIGLKILVEHLMAG